MGLYGPYSFKGGLNTRENVFNLPPNQCFTFTGARVLGGRVYPLNTNTTTLNTFSVSSNVGHGTFWVDPNNIRTTTNAAITVVTAAAKFWTAPWGGDDAAQTFTDRTGAVSVPNGSEPTFFASLNGILVTTFMDTTGINPIQLTAYNVNAANLAGSPPKAGICLTVNGFMFLSANYSSATTLSRVYWSNVGDPQTWGVSNFIDAGYNDGDVVTALGSIGNDLYIFKTNSIWRLSTTTISTSGSVTLGPLVQVSRSYGTSGQQCLDNLPSGNIVFLTSSNHLVVFDGTTFQDLSDPPYPSPSIQPSLNVLYNVPFFINGASVGGSIVKVYKSKNEIWVFGKSSSGVMNDTLYIFNYSENYWSKSTSFVNVNSAFTAGITRPGSALGFQDRLCILQQAGTLAVIDTAQSTNTSQATVITSVDYVGKEIPSSIFVFVEPTNQALLTLYVGYDNASANSIYGQLTPNTGALAVPLKYKVPQSSGVRPRSIQVEALIVLQHATDNLYIPNFYISDDIEN